MRKEKREKKSRQILFCRNEDSYCEFKDGLCVHCGCPKMEVKENEVSREKRPASHHGLPKT